MLSRHDPDAEPTSEPGTCATNCGDSVSAAETTLSSVRLPAQSSSSSSEGSQVSSPEGTPASPDGRSAALRGQNLLVLCVTGAIAGFLSGLFGIGGGTLIVPALVFVGFSQREASATSLVAIIPTALSGAAAYAYAGNIEWIPALVMTVGMVVGVQAGTFCLSRLSEKVLRWSFVAFLVALIAVQVLFVPARGQNIDMSLSSALLLVAVGLVCGFLSGVLGIGGGGVAVPALSLLVGASDLAARGISLVAMIPGALSGSAANIRRGYARLLPALAVGVSAVCVVPAGAWVAAHLSPRVDSLLFAAWLAFLLIRSVYVARSAPVRAA